MGAELNKYIEEINSRTMTVNRAKMLLPLLSILVILVVFWCLKLTGVTLAGDAFCGMEEHVHTEDCYTEGEECTLTEHIHDSSCYSDIKADLETAEDWEATLAAIPPGMDIDETIVAIAESQEGYSESELNYTLDENGEKRGYTRYGEWYGNPYGAWDTMFTSFCLSYAGADEELLSAGAETMRAAWEEKGLYEVSDKYSPSEGDVVFIGSDTACLTAVVTSVEAEKITVFEGDLNNKVSKNEYEIGDAEIIGYGKSTVALGGNEEEENLSRSMLMTADASSAIAKTIDYSSEIFNNGTRSFVVYASDGTEHYAFDGSGNAVQIEIDADGNITSDVSDPNTLLWTFAASGTNSYVIQNLATEKHMHAYPNNGSGVITSGAYASTVLEQSDGTVKIRSNTEYAMLDISSSAYKMTQSSSSAANFRFGYVDGNCSIWLDGTNGGLMSHAASSNERYEAKAGEDFTLPETWPSPGKYAYTLRGWYDVKNSKYYSPGETLTVSDNMVFYADWEAETYDVGQFNVDTSSTVSTDNFIDVDVFDYGVLFNVMSQTATVSASSSGHSETWSVVRSGTVPYKNGETLDFIFTDYDGSGDITYANNRGGNNTSGGDPYSGIYSETLRNVLFATDNGFDPEAKTGIIGKSYLGKGDYLFQLDNDPESDNYGYYYYDSKLNAASYNQSDQRFYVYDYLERTSDSAKDGGEGGYSDFLPLNSPYANTNGKTVNTYTYNGLNGEYKDATHMQYDAKYNTNNNTAGNVGTNFFFGMSMDMEFYLPDSPGTQDEEGNYGNQGINGKDMEFKFSGDDDVWVLVDGKLVLDIGGIHGIEAGTINFSTGEVTINGSRVSTLSDIEEGEHVLTVYYLERGSSQSNCALYFNLAPRFELSIQKEDVLTKEVLNGAEFSVYKDFACTEPVELWDNEAAHEAGEPSKNTFVVKDGVASMWGMSAGKTYYIRETKPPDDPNYSDITYGIIAVSFDNKGTATYSAYVLDDESESSGDATISPGFTVHGFRVDDEKQHAYIVATNAPNWVNETTEVTTYKQWNDSLNHSADSVTVYLTVTDDDGTVRRLQEITLSDANEWKHTWSNLPKYAEDGTTEIEYGVEEAYKEGYTNSIEIAELKDSSWSAWDPDIGFQDGETYLLGTGDNYLSAESSNQETLMWVDKETAASSPLAQWTADVSGNTVKLTNGEGQILSFNYSSYSSNRRFFVSKDTETYQQLKIDISGNEVILYCLRSYRNYYMTNISGSGYLGATTSDRNALAFVPEIMTESSSGEFALRITNTPLEEETAVKVTKVWDPGMSQDKEYEKSQVTIKLLADEIDTGRTVTLNLKNNWTETFMGLPVTSSDGREIDYSVEETWATDDWTPSYSEVTEVADGTYEVTVTNTYKWGNGYLLPATGGMGNRLLILCGFILMMSALVYGCIIRRRHERRLRE